MLERKHTVTLLVFTFGIGGCVGQYSSEFVGTMIVSAVIVPWLVWGDRA